MKLCITSELIQQN